MSGVWSSLGNVMSQLGHCVDQLSTFENRVTSVSTAIEGLENALADRVVPKMRLVELKNLLERCKETILTCNEQVVALANLGSRRLGRQARQQIKKGKLDPQLTEMLLHAVKTRLRHIQETGSKCWEL